MSGFLSPAALVILPLAILIDLVGIILIFFGLDDFWTTDIIAVTFIGGWSYFRSMVGGGETQEVEMPAIGEKRKAARAAKEAKKVTKVAKWAKRSKWLKPLCFLGELIPYVGVLPLWTIFVILELKRS